MGNLSGFDASSVEPNQPRTAIPPGEYLAVISGSERLASKSGNGDLLKFEFTIQGGAQDGRKVFDRLNLWNTNRQASEIAQRQLSAICRAVNVLRPDDSSSLHNRQLVIVVESETYDGKPQARITGYKPKAAVQQAAPQQAVAPEGQQGGWNPFG